jgi:hypothetical protein
VWPLLGQHRRPAGRCLHTVPYMAFPYRSDYVALLQYILAKSAILRWNPWVLLGSAGWMSGMELLKQVVCEVSTQVSMDYEGIHNSSVRNFRWCWLVGLKSHPFWESQLQCLFLSHYMEYNTHLKKYMHTDIELL